MRSVAPSTATDAGVKKLSRAARAPPEELVTTEDAITIASLAKFFLRAYSAQGYTH
jgi:hypothetical protein